MDLKIILSTLFGGSIVLALSGFMMRFIFTRIIRELDHLTEKLQKLIVDQAVDHTILMDKTKRLDRLESQQEDSGKRLIGIEKSLYAKQH